jgi:peptidoglycan/LPS O-acetylase OafA/YrhL
MMNAILLEFIFGMVIYWLYCYLKIPDYIGYVLILLGIAGYGYNIIYGYGNISELSTILTGEGSVKRALLWGLPSAGIVAGCIFSENNKRLNGLWNSQPILLLGTASYSIYLLHYPSFYLVIFLYGKTGFFLNPDLAVLVHMLIAVGIGVLFYKMVERPFLDYMVSKL